MRLETKEKLSSVAWAVVAVESIVLFSVLALWAILGLGEFLFQHIYWR